MAEAGVRDGQAGVRDGRAAVPHPLAHSRQCISQGPPRGGGALSRTRAHGRTGGGGRLR